MRLEFTCKHQQLLRHNKNWQFLPPQEAHQTTLQWDLEKGPNRHKESYIQRCASLPLD